MAKKKSNTAALVEHNVADEEHPDRLPLEQTWPAESATVDNSTPDEEDGTEPFSAHGTTDLLVGFVGMGGSGKTECEIGLSNQGPFIAPAPAAEVQASTPAAKKAKLTVASMTRDHAFLTFRDKLFELCFKYGFTLDGLDLEARDIGDAKGTAKRALAVGNHISGLGLRK